MKNPRKGIFHVKAIRETYSQYVSLPRPNTPPRLVSEEFYKNLETQKPRKGLLCLCNCSI